MSVLQPDRPRALGLPALGFGARLGIFVLAVWVFVMLLGDAVPWLQKWPQALTFDLANGFGRGFASLWSVFDPDLSGLQSIENAFDFVGWALEFPMAWVNWLLTAPPWPLIIAIVTALGWYLGGWPMAALGFLGLSFVLASGYWYEGMNTLALVFVSVPLALLTGLGIGILAYEVPRTKSAIQAVLDVMQTVPTFAYLTPLLVLFGFGPVVGLIASVIYAAPPMARNVLLGLEMVDSEVKEAAQMSGGTRFQKLFQVELPAGARQIAVGINQCLMAALSMVIIAAVIGGFEDIGWEVLLTMRKAQFGQAFLAGLVVVVFAIVIDRMSGTLATERRRYGLQMPLAIVGLGLLAALALVLLPGSGAPFEVAKPDPETCGFGSVTASLIAGTGAPLTADPASFGRFDLWSVCVDKSVGDFTREYGRALDGLKNTAMFYGLLPLKIGLDSAVLPFTWGFQWTPLMSQVFLGLAAVAALAVGLSGRATTGIAIMATALVLETGVVEIPWPVVLVGVGAVGWAAGGPRLSALVTALLLVILLAGLWDRAMLSVYLSGAAVIACAVMGGALGLWAAVSPAAWSVIRPICDMLQTIPLFVFLIPVLMFFQIGEFSAFLAIIAYAIVPMIRYTRHGLVSTPPDLIEAATSAGATGRQIMWDVRVPYAVPTILLGLNQTILYAFAMLVIAALIGTTGLGQSIYIALGNADVGLGVSAGAAMAILAFIADRLVQGFAQRRKEALGL